MPASPTPQQSPRIRKLLGEKKIFLTEWNQKAVDAQWQFLELANKFGILDKVPDEKTHGLVLGD